ncbi:MAG: hypothetical protein ACXVLQ_05115 [Bacteriovorax sp.]
MKKLIAAFLVLHSFSLFAGSLKPVKEIICQATVTYDEESPNEKMPASAIFIFRNGLRKMNDTRNRPGKTSFVLAEYKQGQDSRGLAEEGEQQFYFGPIKEDKVQFEFIADWKAFGELTLSKDGSAKGFINQKTHITELSCFLSRN